jgi:hypothetical protein
MTPVVNPVWRLMKDNRPVHNGKMWAEKDGRIADNWLDPDFALPGEQIRRTNIDGELCNGAADGRARCFHLKPGRYTIRQTTEDGAPLGEFEYAISDPVSPTVFEIRAADHVEIPPANLGVTIHAAETRGREKSADPAENELTVRFRSGSNISEAIKDLLATIEKDGASA